MLLCYGVRRDLLERTMIRITIRIKNNDGVRRCDSEMTDAEIEGVPLCRATPVRCGI